MSAIIMESLPMSPRIRNKMSLAALIMAFMFGWVMFLSAHVIAGGCHEVRPTSVTTAVE